MTREIKEEGLNIKEKLVRVIMCMCGKRYNNIENMESFMWKATALDGAVN